MDKAWLEYELAAGRSIQSIADEVGRDHSTVSYWVRKFGLESAYAARVAPRGGIGAEILEALIGEGLSTREIGERLGLSQSTVRHWLKRHGLQTARTVRRGETLPRIESVCTIHGVTTFVQRRTGYVCGRCRAEAVSRWRRRAKEILVSEAGGRCCVCGYDKTQAALQFHHLDPAEKRFGLGSRGLARAMEHLRIEAAKCVLLCANCHVEVEMGIATLPDAPGRSPR